ETAGNNHVGVSSSDAVNRGESVRHHLPRTLLLFFLSNCGEDSRGIRLDCLRRRRTADAWRLVANLCAARAGLFSFRECACEGACGTRRESWFYTDGNQLFVCRKGKRDQAQDFGFSDSGEAGREIGCRLWCPRQGEYTSQLLRYPQRLSRLHGRPKPLQARQIPGRNAHSG